MTAFFLARVPPPPNYLDRRPGLHVERRTVRGSLTKGRRPYIQFHKEDYRGGLLQERFDLIGHPIVLHFNDRVMTSCEAFTLEGESLGVLKASGVFRHTSHTLAMRKQINRLRKDGDLPVEHGGDAVAALHARLAQESAATALASPKKINKAATKLAASSFKTGLPIGGAPVPQNPSALPPAVSPAPSAHDQTSLAVDRSKSGAQEKVSDRTPPPPPRRPAPLMPVGVKPPVWKLS